MAEEEYEYEPASPTQKINIATYFIMSAPSGEVQDVITDVKDLVNDKTVLTDSKLGEIMKEYNSQQFTAASHPTQKNRKILTTVYGEVSNNSYLDPESGKVLTFNHLSQKFVAETQQKQVLSSKMAEYRAATSKAVAKYVSAHYHSKKASFAVYGSDDGKITVCISGLNMKLSAYWTGGWRSKYIVDVSKSGKQALVGNIKTNVHYFEEGNVQLHTDFNNNSLQITVADADRTGLAIAEAVEKIETTWQHNLEELYVGMHSKTFKAMRRILPISTKPMKWISGQVSLAKSLTAKS